MVKEFMKLRRIQTEISEVLDKLEHGVINGIKTPVDVETVVVKLDVPTSCSNCFFDKICLNGECGGVYCRKIWNKIINHHKNKHKTEVIDNV